MNYKNSGVDVEKGNMFVDIIKDTCKNGKIGGLFISYKYNNLKLVASTDGVGSKLELCKIPNKYDTIALICSYVNIICQGLNLYF